MCACMPIYVRGGCNSPPRGPVDALLCARTGMCACVSSGCVYECVDAWVWYVYAVAVRSHMLFVGI
jgi:hypothetical protein